MSPLTLSGMSGAVSNLTASKKGGSPAFNWRYYAYGSSIGTTRIVWYANGTVNTLRTITGQQHNTTGLTWNTYSEDLSAYSGQTGYIFIVYSPGNDFYNDPQYDNMELVDTTAGTINLDPGTAFGRTQWYGTTTNNYSTIFSPSGVTLNQVIIGTTTTNVWNYDAGGTPSSNTGNTQDADGSTINYYLYFEGSSPNFSISTRYYWCRPLSSYTLL